MSQDEVEQFLKSHRPNFYSAVQMTELIPLSRGTITTNARCLLKWKLIEVRVEKGNKFFYGYKSLPTGQVTARLINKS